MKLFLLIFNTLTFNLFKQKRKLSTEEFVKEHFKNIVSKSKTAKLNTLQELSAALESDNVNFVKLYKPETDSGKLEQAIVHVPEYLTYLQNIENKA